MVVGALVVLGGRYALKRKKWGLALIGSICPVIGLQLLVFGIKSLEITYIYAWFGVLGIPAIILTALSKDEFE